MKLAAFAIFPLFLTLIACGSDKDNRSNHGPAPLPKTEPLATTSTEVAFTKHSKDSLIECKVYSDSRHSQSCRLLDDQDEIILAANPDKKPMRYKVEVNCSILRIANDFFMVSANEGFGQSIRCETKGQPKVFELWGHDDLKMRFVGKKKLFAFWPLKEPKLEVKILSTVESI